MSNDQVTSWNDWLHEHGPYTAYGSSPLRVFDGVSDEALTAAVAAAAEDGDYPLVLSAGAAATLARLLPALPVPPPVDPHQLTIHDALEGDPHAH